MRRCTHCPNLIEPGQDCPDHPRRPWHKRTNVNRNRTREREALKRKHVGPDKTCALGYVGICTTVATELDRIDNQGLYTPDNVAGVCHPCHLVKSSREGHTAQGHHLTEAPHRRLRPEQPQQQQDTHIPRRIDISDPPMDHDPDYWPQPW